MKKLILLSCFSLAAFVAQSQNQSPMVPLMNADEIILQQKVAEDPGLLNRYMVYEENLKMLVMDEGSVKTDTLIDGKRIIPVVFHIIHKGGAENISKAQVEDALARINIDYNKLNQDTTAADSWPGFAARRADCQIEFRLAKIDPDGNCTDGILRHYDPQTNYAYFTTMTDYAWSPSKYLNIFTVNFIYPEGMSLPDGAFIGGMSPFPPSNPMSQALTGGDTLADGVLIRHDCIGSIGTATAMGGMPINALNRTFTHETGHYFNLYHPFQNLMFGLIPASSGCPSFLAPNGDEVADTPPVDVATQNVSISCYAPGSRNTCNQDSPDEPDMVENYMDYQWGYCTNIFTLGQKTRIDATLNGDRRKLWSLENLVATGVLDTNPPACAPRADFTADRFYICAGGNVNFTDQSYGVLPDNWNWTFTGGTPASSTDQNPTVQYSAPGTYAVKLVASNSNGSDSITKTAYIMVSDPALTDTTPMAEDFEAGTPGDWLILNDAGSAWSVTSQTAYSGTKCLWLNNFENNMAGSYDEVISSVYDFTSMPSGAMPVLNFKLAYAGKYVAGTIVTPADTVYDRLSIYQSVDCGASWQQKYNKTGTALTTIATVPDDFEPASQADWRDETVSLSYASLTETDVRFKIVFYSNGGNNIYIDDINITTPALGSPEQYMESFGLSIFPNPSEDVTRISLNLPEASELMVSVYDLPGRKVRSVAEGHYSAGSQSFTLSRNDLGGSGVYLIRISVNGQVVNRKLVMQ